MKKNLLIIVLFTCLQKNNAQNVGIGTNAPAASAMLHINSSNKGLLIPRLTSVQRTAIASPAAGLQVYDTNSNSFWYFNGTAWTEIGAGGSSSNNWLSNGFESIYNSNTGNVGIGTSSPSYKLAVNGDGFFKGEPIVYNYNEQNGYYFSGGAIKLATPFSIYQNKVMAIGGNRLQSFTVDIDDPSVDDYASDMAINPLGGNIGIGTNNPLSDSKLTLQTDADFNTALTIRNPTGSANFQVFVGGPGNQNAISLGTPDAAPIALYTNGANRIFINSTGNVGIGTDNPTYKLAVNGNIRSKEVVVESANWPDYVFNKKYTLLSLEEVAQFILQNNHLPNIPSAEEIEKNGLHVGDLQKRMMEKIEELTLYVIALQKEMDLLKQKN